MLQGATGRRSYTVSAQASECTVEKLADISKTYISRFEQRYP